MGHGRSPVLKTFPDLVTLHIMGEGFTWITQDRERDIAARDRRLGTRQGDDPR
jgi:ATP:corrinoid adenosyltransferase